jgi:inhibitor of KinA
VVAAFGSVTVFYDPAIIAGLAALRRAIEERAAVAGAALFSSGAPVVEIPVCYGGRFGPDLEDIAARCALGVGEVVAMHSGADYVVHAIGFAPGFAYLGGLPEKLRTPRRTTPRTEVAAGSVGIGGAQTGVYPFASPGGWHILGRTPLKMFDVHRDQPALLKSGDHVRFRAISEEEFTLWK